MKLRGIKIFAFAVTLLLALNIHAAAPSCSSLFSEKDSSKTLKAISKKNLKDVVQAVADVIVKTHKIPTTQELADQLGMDVQKLEVYLSKKSTPDMDALIAIARQRNPTVFRELEKKYAIKAGDLLKENFRLPTVKEVADALQISEQDALIVYGGNKDVFLRISEYDRKSLDAVLDALLKIYVKAAKQYGRSPTIQEVAEAEGSKFTLDALNSLVGEGRLVNDINDLFEMAEKKSSKSMKGVVNLEIFNDQRLAKLVRDLKEGERLVISSAIAGATVDPAFMDALETYYKENKAPLFLIPVNMVTNELDKSILDRDFVNVLISEVELGNELKISNIPLTAKQINPLSGLQRIGKRGQSMIVASPKSHAETVATKDNKYIQHILYSTASVNNPNVYQGKQYISKRTDYMAEDDHFMGALIIEKTSAANDLVDVQGHGTFHIRRVEYIPEKRGFMDLNKFYTPEGVQEVRAQALAFGDTHAAEVDQKVLSKISSLIQLMKPHMIFLHDLFDGDSISHYDREKAITMSQKADSGRLNLEDELNLTVELTRSFLEVSPQDTVIYIPNANHNCWVLRYLESGQFMKEPINTRIGLELAQVAQNGENPLEYYFMKKLGTKLMRRIVFIKPEESIYAGPEYDNKPGTKDRRVLMSEHGDRGANGAKGGLTSFQRASDRIAYGHTHTLMWRNNVVNFGTNSINPTPYAAGGFSNWVQAVDIVGPNGEQQVLVFKNGEWYRDPQKQLSSTEQFFESGYPYIKPNNKDPGAIQTDQYSDHKRK